MKEYVSLIILELIFLGWKS